MTLHDLAAPAGSPAVVVIGGANLDFKSRTTYPAIPGTSNPGFSRVSAGGVGRNVAENLGRLGVSTTLITAIGDDEGGARLLSQTTSAGVKLDHAVRTCGASGSYTAILDANGDMIIAVAAMDLMESISAATIEACSDVIRAAAIVIMDCNVPESALVRAAEIARECSARIIVDPVSVPKAERLRSLLRAHVLIHTVTPNLDELRALTGCADASEAKLARASEQLHDDGVAHVWVRLGDRGSFFSARRGDGVVASHLDPCPATLIDATGAGDAMLAAYAAALCCGMDVSLATRYGRAAAAITVECEDSVDPAMTFAVLERRVAQCF
jgi:sugar/nucleoside kinase (ribokinase family)